MSKEIKTSFAIICVVVILASVMGGYAMAEDDLTYDLPSESDLEQASSEAADGREPLILAYTEIPLYVDGVFSGSALKLNDTTYVPVLSFCEAMLNEEFEVLWDDEKDSVSLSAKGVDISLTLSDNYILANGRYLYLPGGAYNINGSVLAPIRELAKIFNVGVEWNAEDWTINIDTSELSIIEQGWSFYDYETLYWLSRVISSESGGTEPLEGMIGVGNVVLNRVNDESAMFEDTVQGVIFQYNQFSVVDNGTIYDEPKELSVIAAKLCLEGYNTVGDSLFFLNPYIAPSYWFQATRTFVVTIANHDFYS